MSRKVVATPLFAARLTGYLQEYAGLGAVRFVERVQAAFARMVANIEAFEEMAPARRRTVGGKTITVREYVLDAGAKDFTVLYWIPDDSSEPILLLNIRIGGQNRFRWKQ